MANEANQPSTPNPDETPELVTDDTHGQEPAPSNLELKAESDNKIEVATEEGDGQWKDEKRKAIFAKAREARKKSMVDYEGPNDPAAKYGVETDTSGLGELEKQALEQQKRAKARDIAAATGQEADGEPQDGLQQSQQQPAPRPLSGNNPDDLAKVYTVIVDGQPRQITAEEALRSFQMREAAEARLQTANQILAGAKQIQKVQAQRQPSGSYEDEADFEDEPSQGGRAANTTQAHPVFDARALAEKIQLGSIDEAAESIGQLIALAQRGASPDPQAVLTVLEDRTSQELTRQYVSQQDDLKTDPHMLNLTTQMIQKEMANDLLKVMPIEELRERVKSATDLTDLHKAYRINRAPGIRSVDQLLQAGHSAARQWRYGDRPQQQAPQQHQQQPSMQARQERKNAMIQQPAQRRQLPANAQAARSIDQARADAVARIRASRGQAT